MQLSEAQSKYLNKVHEIWNITKIKKLFKNIRPILDCIYV